MQKKVLLVLRYAVFLALGLVLAWIPIHSITPEKWAEIKLAMERARYALLVPIVLLYLLSHYSRAVRWKIMINPLGYSPVTVNVFFAVIIGYLVNLALPRLGEVARCTVLGRHEKIPVEQLLGTIIVERAFDLICLLIVFGVAFFLQSSKINDFALDQARGHASGHHMILWLLSALVAAVVVLWLIYRQYKTHKAVQWVRDLLMGIWAGIVRVRYMKNKGWFLFHTVFIWTLYLVCTRLGLYAFRELDVLGWKETFSVLAVGSVAMVVSPGGLGAYPFFVLHTLMFYQVTYGVALAAANLLWIVPTLVIILGGVVSFLGLASAAKSSQNEELPAYRTKGPLPGKPETSGDPVAFDGP